MMIDFLMASLLTQDAQDLYGEHHFVEAPLPSIEIIEPRPLPVLSDIQPVRYLNDNPHSAVLIVEPESGQTLYQKASYRPQYIASITKLMTTLLILENHDLKDPVSVSLKAANTGGANVGLLAYEELTIETLLEAALIPSANDAAVALAIHDSGSEEAFVEKMNARAKELGLYSASFVNATGLDLETITPIEGSDMGEAQWTGNRMSARDVALLAKKVLQYEWVRDTVQKKEFWGVSTDGQFSHEKQNTNKLLWSDLGIKGLKTGYTELAGECLVTLGETADGKEVLVVILGSDARFEETEKALEWALGAWIF